MPLILPPAYEAAQAVENHSSQARQLRAALKAHDRNLSCVWVKDVPEEARPAGTLPGRWHVEIKSDVGLPPTYKPVTGPNGEYREPDFGVLEEVRKMDLRRHGALEEMVRRDGRKTTDRKRAQALADEQRRDEMKVDIRAGKRVAGENLDKKRWGAK